MGNVTPAALQAWRAELAVDHSKLYRVNLAFVRQYGDEAQVAEINMLYGMLNRDGVNAAEAQRLLTAVVSLVTTVGNKRRWDEMVAALSHATGHDYSSEQMPDGWRG